MLYKKPRPSEFGGYTVGLCDGCNDPVPGRSPHWLVLRPRRRTIDLLCKRCRDWMLSGLRDEDNRGENGKWEFRWDGKMTVIDEAERVVLEEQLDDDECIEEDE